MIRRIWEYKPQSGRLDREKVRFLAEVASEWDLRSSSKKIISLRYFDGNVGKCAEVFESVHGGNGIGKRNAEGRRLLEFCDEKELCLANTWFYKKENRKIICCASECKTEIDLVFVGKKDKKHVKDTKVIL